MPKKMDNIVKLPRKLPKRLRPFFWDCRFSQLDGERDGDFVAYRILESGDWASLLWLCRKAGEEPLKALVRHHHGRGQRASSTGRLAHVARQPADRASHGQSNLEAPLWHGPGEDPK